MPEISVIMAVYNLPDEKIMSQSIGSILNQSYQDIELIICDDGSTDNTYELLVKFAEKDSRIKLIRNTENRKAGYARNCCLQVAQGKYIAVADADDIYPLERLELEKEFLDKHLEYAFVGSKGKFFKDMIGDDEECYWFCEKPNAKDFLFSLPFAHASCMFRKEPLNEIGGYSAKKIAFRVEDYDMFLRLYVAGYQGYNLSEILYYIRRDENQYKRRKYRYRFNEAYMKYRHFGQLGLMPHGIIYVLKPLVVGFIPWRLSAMLQRKYYQTKG